MTEYRAGILKQSTLRRYLKLGLFGASALLGRVSAEVITGEEEQTGLRTWEWRQEGFSVQLVQRLPDQTRAFFQWNPS